MQDGTTPARPTDADRFQAMADQIRHNNGAVFGGAFMIIPPGQGGEPMQALILDASGDAVQFFMLLQAKVQTRLTELQERARQTNAFR